MKKLILIFTSITLFATFALAEHHEGKVDHATHSNGHNGHHGKGHNQRMQNKRIRHGVKNGQLTKDETLELRKQQLAIREKKRTMRADGKIDKVERKELHRNLSQASKDIHAEKHDADKQVVPTTAAPAAVSPTEETHANDMHDGM